jgi:hypothetical protein
VEFGHYKNSFSEVSSNISIIFSLCRTVQIILVHRKPPLSIFFIELLEL